MGYFSNGTEGADYEEKYCNHCVHQLEDYGCPCWNAHYFWNYDECNKADSILHKIIPRDTENKQCVFYVFKKGGN